MYYWIQSRYFTFVFRHDNFPDVMRCHVVEWYFMSSSVDIMRGMMIFFVERYLCKNSLEIPCTWCWLIWTLVLCIYMYVISTIYEMTITNSHQMCHRKLSRMSIHKSNFRLTICSAVIIKGIINFTIFHIFFLILCNRSLTIIYSSYPN